MRFFISRQSVRNAAFLLAFLGIFCLSIALVDLAFLVTGCEKARATWQPERIPPKSRPQSKLPNQSNEGLAPGEPELLFHPNPGSVLKVLQKEEGHGSHWGE
jgi:hypothetical protein